MNIQYSDLLSPFSSLSENNCTYNFLTERHLQAIWLEQKYFKDLKTAEGKEVRVISPGIWNGDAGPDFLKAHLLINGKEVQGDIEIHLADEGWVNHGHDKDSRYNNVIFHLSLWQLLKNKPLIKQNGLNISQGYLDPCLTIPHARIVHLIDLDLYPYKKFIGSGKCAQQLFRSISEDKISTLFTSAALYRLVRKYDHLVALAGSHDYILGAGVASALGYKHNSHPFLELFLWAIKLKAKYPSGEQDLFVTFLGKCGFFEEVYYKRWANSQKYMSFKNLWEKQNKSTRFKLVLNQVRPYNHPIRRLSFLAKWIESNDYLAIEKKLHQTWTSQYMQCQTAKEWRRLFDLIVDLVPTYEDTYWNHHYTFETNPQPKLLPLAGEDLKETISINTFLPILYQSISKRNNSSELHAFIELYSVISTTPSGKSRYLTHRFFGETPKGKLLKQRKIEQGAFQIHRDFCIHFESSCEGCPFVNRYKDSDKNLFD